MFVSEASVQEPGKRTGDQEDNHSNEANAFDLLLVDHVQEMIMAEICFLSQHAKYVMHFEYSYAQKPHDSEHQTNLRDNSQSRAGHC